MKQAYTQYIPALTKLSKQTRLSMHDLLSDIDSPEYAFSRRNRSSLKSVLHAENDVLSGKGHHIYLHQKEFCDWLVSQAEMNNREHIDFLYEHIANDMPLIFHFPTNSGLSSFLVFKKQNYQPPTASNVHGKEYTCASWDEDEDDPYNSNLVYGLGLYLKCFPECLVQGVPEDLKHPSHHVHFLSYSINLSPKVRAHNGTHASPCGHFRRGHFRVLNSEWYKKKRHQVVFIDETFVNGKAYTVLSPEEVDSSSSSCTSIA